MTRAQVCAAAHAALRAARAEQGIDAWMQIERERVCEMRDAVHLIVQSQALTPQELLASGWQFFGSATPDDAALLISIVRALEP